jgi:hypothetical protein
MEVFIVPVGVLFFTMFFLASGVLLFGAKASLTACTTDPTKTPNPVGNKCSTGEAGLCPLEDNTGGLRMMNKNKLNRFDSKL